MSDNPLTEEVAKDLAAALVKQPAIRAVNLNDTGLTDAGVIAVCGSLLAAAQLEELELALNEVTLRGARAIGMILLARRAD